MKLYKAICYDGKSDMVFDSGLMSQNVQVNSWIELVKTMYTHISHGDRKTEKDCWISATSSFDVALNYLHNTKYNFNCIAEIDLPNTSYTGDIFDDTLKKYGYVDKDLKNNILMSRGNQDGVIALYDFSQETTLLYVGMYLWLKGETDALGNFRAYRNAKKSEEILLLANNIKFSIICEKEYTNYQGKVIPLIGNKCSNLYVYLDKIIKERNDLFGESEKYIEEYCERMRDIIRDNEIERGCYWEDEFIEVECDKWKLKYEYINRINAAEYNGILSYFQNAKYRFKKENEQRYYYGTSEYPSFYALKYEEKDIIEFDKYSICEEINENITIVDLIKAYMNVGLYIFFKDSKKKSVLGLIFGLNKKLKNKYLTGKISEDDFYSQYQYLEGWGIWSDEQSVLKSC